jgi:creatinine amidohydrolase
VQPHVGARLYGLPDFEANRPGFASDGKSGGDHAGRVETSLLWALEPDAVDLSRLPAPDDAGQHFAMGPDAYEANRRIGERMVADEVRWLTAKVRELLDAYATAKPQHRLRTFEEVEALWERVVRPQLKHFLSMQQTWQDPETGKDRPPVPSTSVWFDNARVPDRDE